MHYFKFNISDYKSHTEHLDEMEDLAYRRMLDWLYLHEKPLPKSVDEISRLIRMRTHSECITNVLREFMTLIDDGYINERCEIELGEFTEKSKSSKKAAEARWKKERAKRRSKNKELSSDANALQTESESNTKHKTLNTKHETLNITQSKSELSAIKIADYLASKIKNANPQTRPKPEGWVNDIEKTIRIDGRSESDLISIIDWMYQGDQFWSGVILSGKKLREKYDTMIVHKNNKGAQNETNRGNSQLTGAAAQKAAVLERIKNM